MRAKATGVNHALRDALVIEMEDLLAKVKIFQSGRPSRTDFERVLIVGNGRSLLGGQNGDFPVGGLVEFAALAAHHIFYTSLLLLHSVL